MWQDLEKVLDSNQHWKMLDEGRLYKYDGTVAEGKKVLEELGYALCPPCSPVLRVCCEQEAQAFLAVALFENLAVSAQVRMEPRSYRLGCRGG
jgi:hypothetical protein